MFIDNLHALNNGVLEIDFNVVGPVTPPRPNYDLEVSSPTSPPNTNNFYTDVVGPIVPPNPNSK